MYTLEQVEAITLGCNKCDLANTRTKVVFGEGNKNADIMFIGEGPGYNEDIQGKPFVGPAGRLLDKMLYAIDIKRQDVYITNVVKCRPPNNRNPLVKETKTCIEYLRWQVKLVDPKIIICLGAVSARNIIGPDFKITIDRGKWMNVGKYSVIATYHPAALLRDENKKRPAWEDFKSIKNKYQQIIQNEA